MNHRPRKRFGQHFLADRSAIRRIVDSLQIQRSDNLVEIGPGRGALTEPLAERVDHLRVIEIDRDLAAALRTRFPADRVEVIEADALDVDFGSLGEDLRVVGNLPYNISTPLLFRVAAAAGRLRDVTVMLQKEVVDRMTASPATPAYGRLSVMLQYAFEMTRLFEVAPGAFHPPPRVRSAVVRLVPKRELPLSDTATFARIATAAFVQRRKTLRNALRGHFDETRLRELGFDPQVRGETLSVADYVRLAQAWRPLSERV